MSAQVEKILSFIKNNKITSILIFVGLLVFFPALLPLVPREGIAYAGIILAIGAAGLAYGLMGAA